MSTIDIHVVIPALNAGATLARALDGLIQAGFPAEAITVVDDHSNDNPQIIAQKFGVDLATSTKSKGAAAARNLGAEQAVCDLILFVDADVVVRNDVRDRLVKWANANPNEAAIFGSYDDRPSNQNRVSRIRNLLHHHTHQTAPQSASTFWTGLGAVRKVTFDTLGGFDPDQRFMEDIGFGHKLKTAGYTIRLDPDLQGSHLKNWSLVGFMRTDLLHRAIPWTRLIKNKSASKTLNVSMSGMASVISAFASILSLCLLPVSAPLASASFAICIAAMCCLNFGFLTRLAKLNGGFESLSGVLVLWLHFLMAGLGYLWVQLRG